MSPLAYLKIGAFLVALAAGGGFLWRYVSLEKEVAHERAKDEILDGEREAADEAQKARARVRACFASGRVWDIQTGTCRDR